MGVEFPKEEKRKKNVSNFWISSPRLNVDGKMIPEFHKALVAVSDFPFEQRFLSHQLLACLLSLTHFAVSKSTNTQYSDFCKFWVDKRY
jgi:hypothetical protein